MLFGCNGIPRTLEYWEGLLDDAFKLIESLRAELFKSRAETPKALGEKEKAGSECIHAKLKLDQMQAHLDNAQEALHARAQDRRAREVKDAFDQADIEYGTLQLDSVLCEEVGRLEPEICTGRGVGRWARLHLKLGPGRFPQAEGGRHILSGPGARRKCGRRLNGRRAVQSQSRAACDALSKPARPGPNLKISARAE